MATCWLNSCLQLVLTAVDHNEYAARTFDSELGQELLLLQSNSNSRSLDPTKIKQIIMKAEDVRISRNLSELSYEILDQRKLVQRSNVIKNFRLNLSEGQQCVRDFFICLSENLVSWPDVYSNFSFNAVHSTECLTCQQRITSETTQIYLDMSVPPEGSSLKHYVEDMLNEGSRIVYHCESCDTFGEKIKKKTVSNIDEAKFLIVILTRGIETIDGFKLVKNKINSADNISIR